MSPAVLLTNIIIQENSKKSQQKFLKKIKKLFTPKLLTTKLSCGIIARTRTHTHARTHTLIFAPKRKEKVKKSIKKVPQSIGTTTIELCSLAMIWAEKTRTICRLTVLMFGISRTSHFLSFFLHPLEILKENVALILRPFGFNLNILYSLEGSNCLQLKFRAYKAVK